MRKIPLGTGNAWNVQSLQPGRGCMPGRVHGESSSPHGLREPGVSAGDFHTLQEEPAGKGEVPGRVKTKVAVFGKVPFHMTRRHPLCVLTVLGWRGPWANSHHTVPQAVPLCRGMVELPGHRAWGNLHTLGLWMAQDCNPRTPEAEAGGSLFETSLDYILRPCLKKI